MQKLGIDVDNVIADTIDVFLAGINSYFGCRLKPRDIHIYDIEPILGVTRNETRPFFDELFRKRKLLACPVMKGAKNAIKKLKNKYKIYIITSRPKEHEGQTIEWLNKNGILYDRVMHVTEKRKHLYTRKLGIKLFIEDDLEQAVYMAEDGMKVFLIDQPWNRTLDVKKRITRVKNWAQILSKL